MIHDESIVAAHGAGKQLNMVYSQICYDIYFHCAHFNWPHFLLF